MKTTTMGAAAPASVLLALLAGAGAAAQDRPRDPHPLVPNGCDAVTFRNYVFDKGGMDRALMSGVGCRLAGADLRGERLRGAYLPGADLRRARCAGADLRDAILWGASMRWADCAGADFRGASLRRVDCAGADFGGADFRGASLKTGCLGTGADLRGAKYDDGTAFPRSFDPEARGMVRVED